MSVPLEGRDGLEQESGDQARCMLSVVRRPDETLKVISDLGKRDRQCANT